MAPTHKPKLLIVSPSQGSYGGIEAFMLALGRHLAETQQYEIRLCLKMVRGHTVDNRLQKIIDDSSLHCRIVQRASMDLWRAIYWADIVHAQNASPDIALAARLGSAKLVQTIHNHLLDRGAVRTLSWRLGAALSHWRTFNSNFVRSSWESKPKSNSEVVPTVSEMRFDFAPLPPRKGFVFIARLIPNKGADTLIEAYQLAKIDHDAWPLTLLGDGPLRDSLHTLRSKAPDGISLRGFVSDQEKFEILKFSKWLIAPPNTREDMGLTPLEARACGIPVIASRDGGLAEAAGASALLCEPGSITDLKTQLERAASMSEVEYEERARTGFESLATHLKPLSHYETIYSRLLS